MGALARLRRSIRRQTRAMPRRGRKVVRVAVTLTQAGAASRLARGDRKERAIDLLAAAARRSPQDQLVAKSHAQLLSRTGRISEAVAEASRLALSVPQRPAHLRLQRVLQGRWVETDPNWRPVVPGPSPVHDVVPGRVLYLAKESMPHRNNGYCTRTHETLLAVRAAGRDPVAVTLPGFGTGTSSVVDGIEYHHVLPDAARLLSGLTGEEYVQLTTAWFARELLRVRPAVLHAGSGHRGFDLALPGLALAGWAGLPWIYEVRSFFETTWTADERYAESAEYYHRRFGAESRVMRAADVVVTLSGPMRDEIVSGHGVDPDSVFVVPNAVDLERFGPDRPEQRRDDEKRRALGLSGFVLGYVSNLDHHREGQEVLLKAAARLRARGVEVSVLLVGDGRRRHELEELADSLRLGGACVFAGSVPFDEVPAWYAQIDLFVVPRVPERAARMVSPMKPFEAMAMRVPVLVSDLPALVEIAGPDEARAFVFEAGDDEALAARVERLIAAPEALAARADTAQRWVRAERTWAANGRAFDEIYGVAAEVAAKRTADGAVAGGVGADAHAAARPGRDRRELGVPDLRRRLPDAGGDRPPIVWPFTPFYSGNPFQSVLYSGFAERSMVAAPTFAVEHLREATRGWPTDLPLVVHLHWLNQVLAGVSDAAGARVALDRHSGLLDELQSRGARLVWTLHNVLPHDTALEEFEVRLRQDVIDRAALVHVMSPRTAELVAPWFTLPADRIYRCDHPGYQGVYPDWISRADARQRLRIPDGAVVVLLTGALKPYKGLSELLGAVRAVAGDPSLRQVVLVVAGKPDDAAETSEFLARAYLEPWVRVLPGTVADSDVQILLRACDLVALPYRRSLNSGVLALALTFGRPVLLPANSGSLPVVSDFPGAALTYDPDGGEEALVAALRRALTAGDEAREAWGEAAAAAGARIDRATVAARFASDLRGWADTGVVPGRHA